MVWNFLAGKNNGRKQQQIILFYLLSVDICFMFHIESIVENTCYFFNISLRYKKKLSNFKVQTLLCIGNFGPIKRFEKLELKFRVRVSHRQGQGHFVMSQGLQVEVKVEVLQHCTLGHIESQADHEGEREAGFLCCTVV